MHIFLALPKKLFKNDFLKLRASIRAGGQAGQAGQVGQAGRTGRADLPGGAGGQDLFEA